MEKLINIDEVAVYLNLDPQLVRALVKEGIIPAYRIAGSFLRFDKEEIEKQKDTILKNAAEYHSTQEHKNIQTSSGSWKDSVVDFFYFYDFYIICTLIIAVLLFFIFR